ncbi:MAG: hypothetical protein A2289_00400 [Deltaproteobacteria bacterium RIFOXYA12_FULL_58_15]|nr:MAG: hypothetical protein A2289_00400 [Deltaproteobacteria bacterium RIFOXYA12_FULL_58_15]OGR12014.1 MAG: hypothetical protein A2341_06790 [Deltaproteobacteria bacterium RIFOXYB12_FULL_58_9]
MGAAGSGPEVAYLRDQGYQVDALEPSRDLAERCRRMLGPNGEVVVASYEELSRSVLDGEVVNPAARIANSTYDAVLLGFGSLSHVLDLNERGRLLSSCVRLAPAGPILASFWLAAKSRSPGRAGRAEHSGRFLGGLIRRVRRLPAHNARLSFGSWYGFAHSFARDEIEDLAKLIGRGLVWCGDAGIYPHVVFTPCTAIGYCCVATETEGSIHK